MQTYDDFSATAQRLTISLHSLSSAQDWPLHSRILSGLLQSISATPNPVNAANSEEENTYSNRVVEYFILVMVVDDRG